MTFINLGETQTVPPGVVADKLASITPKGTGAVAMLHPFGKLSPECAKAPQNI